MLSALRGVLKEAWRLGLVSAEDYHRGTDLKPIKGETLPRGRALKPGEVISLLSVCAEDISLAGPRDAAIVAVMVGSGLRLNELVNLDFSNYDAESEALRVRSGKGGKDRITYLASGVAEILADWLSLRGNEPGPLFCPINKGGKLNLRRLTGQSVYEKLVTRAKEAKVASFSPHDLSRTFISDLLEAGGDIATVQKLAGHASVTTTTRYDRRGEAAKKKTASLLHIPYQGNR